MVILKNIKTPNGKKSERWSLASSNTNKLNVYENKTCETRSISRLSRQCEKGPQVPDDGNCGAHALAVCLNDLGYSLSIIDILKIINIQNCQTGYYLTDENLTFICNTLNKNLIILHEDHREMK
jgi:hypothetical protein